jgi:RHS repeat-associated protein
VYDALNRRVAETVGATTTDLYYSAGWQVLEERVGTATKARYVWSPVYVDALILRDRDGDNNSGTGTNGLEERLWVMQDANWNVVGLVNGSGVVVERYAYDAFGAVTVMNGSWTVGSTAYGWQHYHQGLKLDVAGYDNRGRIYDPVLGRFRNLDPIRYEAGDVNLYRYVGNSPVDSLDPLGLEDLKEALERFRKKGWKVHNPPDSREDQFGQGIKKGGFGFGFLDESAVFHFSWGWEVLLIKTFPGESKLDWTLSYEVSDTVEQSLSFTTTLNNIIKGSPVTGNSVLQWTNKKATLEKGSQSIKMSIDTKKGVEETYIVVQERAHVYFQTVKEKGKDGLVLNPSKFSHSIYTPHVTFVKLSRQEQGDLKAPAPGVDPGKTPAPVVPLLPGEDPSKKPPMGYSGICG